MYMNPRIDTIYLQLHFFSVILRMASLAKSIGLAAIPAAAAAGPWSGAEGCGRVGAVYL